MNNQEIEKLKQKWMGLCLPLKEMWQDPDLSERMFTFWLTKITEILNEKTEKLCYNCKKDYEQS